MRFAKWLSIGTGVALLTIALGIGTAWIATAPKQLPQGSVSASRLKPGPHPVGKKDLQWVDESRWTAENGKYPGAAKRAFSVSMWFPKGFGGPHPLLVFSHGLMSSRRGCTYMAEHLASHGYIVLSADHPLTHFKAPGGPDYLDVVNQPADVSFLIDQALALEAPARPFNGQIDPKRIGVFGISLGGATATLVAFHPEWRDHRVAAAISIAGPGDIFGPRFFDHASVPFLMIAGTSDAIVDYETNALPIPERIHHGALVSFAGGTHVGFTHVAAGIMRLLGNPDKVGCRLGGAKPEASPENPFNGLFGTPEQGLLEVVEYPPPCVKTFERTMAAGRQQMLTTLVVCAFFESHFAREPEVRANHKEFLARILPAELPEVTYTPSRR